MKRIRNVAGVALGAAFVFAGSCDTIRDYSVNSYQGALPSGDLRPSGSVPLTQTDSPRPATLGTPAAAPAAGAEGAAKPVEPAK